VPPTIFWSRPAFSLGIDSIFLPVRVGFRAIEIAGTASDAMLAVNPERQYHRAFF